MALYGLASTSSRVVLVGLGCAAAAAGAGPIERLLAAPSPTPTSAALPERLLEPTLPPAPGEADLGAQVFWSYCLPCHGDRGQGLTPEFRELYPPEEQDCWQSGCHGERPYDYGFTLPGTVPAVIGGAVVERFSTAASLGAFVRATMPRQDPGSLSPEDYDQVIAYLARENGLPPGPAVSITGAPTEAGPEPTAVHLRPVSRPSSRPWLAPAVVVLVGVLAAAALLVRRRRPPSDPGTPAG